MRYIKLLPFICILFLNGCEIMGPSLKVEGPKVKVEDGHGHGDGDGDFCPPGQAKKGNC